ncbi:MAG: zinc ribbon domain-containing protein [Vicinamibacterales bacterium]
MFCPSYKRENRAGRKFCVHCGAGLELRCASCGARAEPRERFCGECGKSLAGLAPATAPDPRSYTPKHLADKILASRSARSLVRFRPTARDRWGRVRADRRVEPFMQSNPHTIQEVRRILRLQGAARCALLQNRFIRRRSRVEPRPGRQPPWRSGRGFSFV